MFPRIGAKSRLKKRITQLIPDHSTYVEPFVGGGSVFLYKTPAKREIINDKDEDVYNTWKDMKEIGEKMTEYDWTGSQTTFERLRKQTVFATPEERLYRNLYLPAFSYASNCQGYLKAREGYTVKKYQTSKFKDRLREVEIFNEDYSEMLNRFDSDNTFFYLDPPYSTEKKTTGWTYKSIPITTLKYRLDRLQGKWLLSLNKSPNHIDLFKDYKIEEVKLTYPTKRKSDGRCEEITELLIRNY